LSSNPTRIWVLFNDHDSGAIERLTLPSRIHLVGDHLSYPEKNRIETKHNHQGKYDVTPFAYPKRILRRKGEQNV
jgi:hypothetical protein